MPDSAVVGSILGTAVGDALGVPYEGLSPARAARLLGPPDRYRLLAGRGMVSDDTEHTALVAQALIAAPDDPERFARHLARGLRWWLAAVPAGIGLATLRACVKLWLGFPPDRSGVFSAGNGPAMRAAVVGAALRQPDRFRPFLRAATRVTHTDPKSERAAFAVSLAAAHAADSTTVDADAYLQQLSTDIDEELLELLQQAAASAGRGETTAEFAAAMGWQRGVSGYACHSVPAAIHAWLRHPDDFRAAVMGVIECGGDADTTAAIVGGIVGAGTGETGIPEEWIRGLRDWPRTTDWLRVLAGQLDQVLECGRPAKPATVFWPAVVLRNGVFAAIVIGHALRRLLPPW